MSFSSTNSIVTLSSRPTSSLTAYKRKEKKIENYYIKKRDGNILTVLKLIAL